MLIKQNKKNNLVSKKFKHLHRVFVLFILLTIPNCQNISAQQKAQPKIVEQIKMIIMSQIDSLHNEFIRMQKDSVKKNRLSFHRLIGASDNEINLFRSSLNELEKKINNKDGKIEALQITLNSLQLKKISALPEFYDKVHKSLQKKLNDWKEQKNIADKKSLESYLNKSKNLSENISTKTGVDTIKRNSSSSETKNGVKDIEIGGLVVDETQTKLGHDFYDLFYQKWDNPQMPNDFTIVISEKPIPSLGTQISVKINETEIFQNRLQSRYELIEELADYAVELSLNYLQNYDEIQKELNGDEMKGTGIF